MVNIGESYIVCKLIPNEEGGDAQYKLKLKIYPSGDHENPVVVIFEDTD